MERENPLFLWKINNDCSELSLITKKVNYSIYKLHVQIKNYFYQNLQL